METLMEVLSYVLYLFLGIGGIVLHLVFKVKSLQDKLNAAREPFDFTKFLKEDKWTIIGNLTFITLLLAFVPDLKEEIEKSWHMKATFVCGGYMGSDIAHRFFSAANKKYNKIIEDKTTEAELNK